MPVIPLMPGNRVVMLDPSTVATETNCCCTPCGDVSVLCEQIIASANKCGIPGYMYTGVAPFNKWYLLETWTGSGSQRGWNIQPGPDQECPDGEEHFACAQTEDWVKTQSYSSDDCSTSGTCSGTYTASNAAGCSSTCSYVGTGVNDCGTQPGCVICGCGGGVCGGGDCGPFGGVTVSDTLRTCDNDCDHSGIGGGTSGCVHEITSFHGTIELSNEYTTEQLIANTISRLPSYTDEYSEGLCTASRNLSDDEQSYTISRFKPKFVLSEVKDTDTTFCYVLTTTPYNGDPPTYDIRQATIPAGETELIGEEITEPSEDGQITLDLGCHCLATLSCDQVMISKNKCGFRPFGGGYHEERCDPFYGYININCVSDPFYSNCTPGPADYYLIADCGPCPEYTGNPVHNIVDPNTCTTDSGCHIEINSNNCICPDCYSFPYPCGEGFHVAISSLYPDDLLLSLTLAAIPPYDDSYTGECKAIRNLSDNKDSFSISRFKPKFSISDPLDHDLPIYYNEHYEPDDGDPVDTARHVVIPTGETEVIGDEVTEPDENGQITITDICCPPS